MDIDSIYKEMDWKAGAILLLACSAVLSTLVVYGSTWIGGLAAAL